MNGFLLETFVPSKSLYPNRSTLSPWKACTSKVMGVSISKFQMKEVQLLSNRPYCQALLKGPTSKLLSYKKNRVDYPETAENADTCSNNTSLPKMTSQSYSFIDSFSSGLAWIIVCLRRITSTPAPYLIKARAMKQVSLSVLDL